MANNKITTTELDFDKIKTSLKTYLQGQSQFSDYDFEGSGLSVLLDVLAYNTHYNALYTNLAINEAFLDSASKRSSVVSQAKELGYTPHSATASTAVVDVVMINNQISAPAALEIPIYTPFSTQVDGKQYTFYTTQSHTATKSGNTYEFNNITLKEGSVIVSRSTVNNASNTSIVIPNTGVDLSTLRVIVNVDSQSTAFDTYTSSDNIIGLNESSLVYFVKEIDNQQYQIDFGDDIIGKALDVGNVVTLTYMVCNRDAPNGAQSFLYNGTLATNTESFVTTVSKAIGGSDVESIESIKWNAPHSYASQNRCVNVDDYRNTIIAHYPDIRAVNVWGGDIAVPPQYGKVFISIVPSTTELLSEDQKTYIIENIINPRKMLSTTPVIVDPTYIKIQLDVSFYYDPLQTTNNAGDLTTLVNQTITDYNTTHLTQFGSVFKYSKLSSLIDSTERSITSNVMSIKLHREVTPIFNVTSGYQISLGNPIYNSGVPEESAISSGFYCTESTEVCYIDDLPVEDKDVGSLRLFYYNAAGEKVIIRTCGSIVYSTGTISVDELNVTSLASEVSEWIIKPQSNDVASIRDQFVTIEPSYVTITPVIDGHGESYTFTSSRN